LRHWVRAGNIAATPVAKAFIARQRLVNLFVTNVAGPPVPAYLLGARIVDVIPIVSPSGNVSVAFCAFSYAGCLYLVATVDAAACPDVDRLIAGAEDAWRDLCDGPRSD
jgi:diacylglycerol O-acyltransferase